MVSIKIPTENAQKNTPIFSLIFLGGPSLIMILIMVVVMVVVMKMVMRAMVMMVMMIVLVMVMMVMVMVVMSVMLLMMAMQAGASLGNVLITGLNVIEFSN